MKDHTKAKAQMLYKTVNLIIIQYNLSFTTNNVFYIFKKSVA